MKKISYLNLIEVLKKQYPETYRELVERLEEKRKKGELNDFSTNNRWAEPN